MRGAAALSEGSEEDVAMVAAILELEQTAERVAEVRCGGGLGGLRGAWWRWRGSGARPWECVCGVLVAAGAQAAASASTGGYFVF